jgi:hypothetical protein
MCSAGAVDPCPSLKVSVVVFDVCKINGLSAMFETGFEMSEP